MISTSSVCAWSGKASTTSRNARTEAPTRPCGAVAAVLAGGLRDALDDDVDGGVEQREDALLLVAEVLVERRLRHPGLARDRLGGGVGEAGAGEDGRGRREQPRALAVLPDLERRGVAASRCCLLLAHRPDGRGTTLWRPHAHARPPAPARSSPPPSPAAARRRPPPTTSRAPRRTSPTTIEDLQTAAQSRKPSDDLLATSSSRALADKLKSAGQRLRRRDGEDHRRRRRLRARGHRRHHHRHHRDRQVKARRGRRQTPRRPLARPRGRRLAPERASAPASRASARTGARSTRGSRRSGSAPTTTALSRYQATVWASPSPKRIRGSQPSARTFSEESE